MSQYNDLDTLNGFYKTVYADKLKDLIPTNVKLAKMIKLVPANKRQGLDYRQPISLTTEQGVTYGG